MWHVKNKSYIFTAILPFLYPIENVWKYVKQESYNSYYTNLKELIEVFEDAFMSRVYSRTYYENWLEKFFAQNLR